jgi:hypothetical protein
MWLQEEGITVDETNDPFLGDAKKFEAIEAKVGAARHRGEAKVKGESARKSALNADQDAWETNRLLTRCGCTYRIRMWHARA